MLDYKHIFSDAQAITANATTVDSTNVVDQGALVDERGNALNQYGPENGKMILHVSIGVKPTAGTGIQCELHDCATEGGTYKPTGIGVNAAIPIATLVVGYSLLKVALPPGLMRFLKIVYTTTGDHGASAGTTGSPDTGRRSSWCLRIDSILLLL